MGGNNEIQGKHSEFGLLRVSLASPTTALSRDAFDRLMWLSPG